MSNTTGNLGDLILHVMQVLPADHPKRIFYEWFIAAAKARDLPGAMRALGVEPVKEGPNLVGRIEQAVLPVLLARHGAQP